MYPIKPEPRMGISRIRAVSEMDQLLNKLYNTLWKETLEIREATLHISGFSSCQISASLSRNIRDLRLATGLLTGHLKRPLELQGAVTYFECWNLVSGESRNIESCPHWLSGSRSCQEETYTEVYLTVQRHSGDRA